MKIIIQKEQTQLKEHVEVELNKIKSFENRIINNKTEINQLNDRIVGAFESLGGVSKPGESINDMMKDKQMKDDVEKVMVKMLNECSLLELKRASEEKINDLSHKLRDHEEKNEQIIKDLKTEKEQMMLEA